MEYERNFDTLWSHACVIAVVPSLRVCNVCEGLMFVNVVDETGNVVVPINFLLLYIVYAQ